MAIIQCPECGQDISDKSEHCIHCGASIFVCPECGEVLTSKNKICKNCGFSMDTTLAARPEADAEQKLDNETSVKIDVVDSWLKQNPQEIKRRKIAKIILLFCEEIVGILGLTLWVIIVLAPWINYQDKDPVTAAEMFLNYESYIRNTWIIASIVIICFTIARGLRLYISSWDIRCIKWLKVQNVDIKSALKKETSDLFSAGIREYDNNFKVPAEEIKFMYYSALKTTNRFTILNIIENVLLFITSIIIICNVANFGIAMINNALMGEEMIEGIWWFVKQLISIPLLISVVINLIYDFIIFPRVASLKIDRYLKQIISE